MREVFGMERLRIIKRLLTEFKPIRKNKFFFEDVELLDDRIFITEDKTLIFNLNSVNNVGVIKLEEHLTRKTCIEAYKFILDLIDKNGNIILNCNVKNVKMVKMIKKLYKKYEENSKLVYVDKWVATQLNIKRGGK